MDHQVCAIFVSLVLCFPFTLDKPLQSASSITGLIRTRGTNHSVTCKNLWWRRSDCNHSDSVHSKQETAGLVSFQHDSTGCSACAVLTRFWVFKKRKQPFPQHYPENVTQNDTDNLEMFNIFVIHSLSGFHLLEDLTSQWQEGQKFTFFLL